MYKHYRSKRYNSSAIGEDKSKASANIKHLINNNNTRTAIISSASIHYRDEATNEWRDIDDTTFETENILQSKLGNYSVDLVNSNNHEAVNVHDETDSIRWEFLGKAICDMPDHTPSVCTDKPRKLRVLHSEVPLEHHPSETVAVFEDTDGEIDLEYKLTSDGIKENIVIRELSSAYNFRFALYIEGFTMNLSEDGASIQFFKEAAHEDARPAFIMPKPFMYDMNGNRSDSVTYSIENEDSGTILTVSADPEWINAPERVLPVFIDPQLSTDAESFFAFSHTKTTGTTNITHPHYDHIYVCRYSDHSVTPTITFRKSLLDLTRVDVIQAKLNLFKHGNQTNADTVTMKIGRTTVTHLNASVLSVDITDVFNEAASDFCVEVKMLTSNSERNFSFSPSLELTYHSKDFSHPLNQTIPVADGATIEHNIYSGNAVFAFSDISDPVLGVSVSHIYKPNDELTEYGHNYRLNLDEKLTAIPSNTGRTKYVYSDEVGDKHTFDESFYYIDASGNKVFVSEPTVVDVEGRFWFNDIEVFRELTTVCGLRATTRIDGVNDCEYIEQRMDEEKQVEEQMKSYENTLRDFVMHPLNHKHHEYCLNEIEDLTCTADFEAFIKKRQNYILLPRAELASYHSLVAQRDSLDISKSVLETQKKALQENIEETYRQVELVEQSKSSVELQIHSINSHLLITEAQRQNHYDTLKEWVENDKSSNGASTQISTYGTMETGTEVDISGQEDPVNDPDDVGTDNGVSTDYQQETDTEVDIPGQDDPVEEPIGLIKSNYHSQMNELLGYTTDLDFASVDQNLVDYFYNVPNNTTVYTQTALLVMQKNQLNEQLDSYTQQKEHLENQTRGSDPNCETTKQYYTTPAPTDGYGTLILQLIDVEKQLDNVVKQVAAVDEQIALFDRKSGDYHELVNRYYKEYLNLNKTFTKLKEQIPVSYLQSDSIIKGFNANGDLVVIYDKYGNYLALEREVYSTSGNTRISAIYDKKERAMRFHYNGKNMLSEIVNSVGTRTVFKYDNAGWLNRIEREKLPSLDIVYTSNRIASVSTDQHTMTVMEYTSTNLLSAVSLYTTAQEISNGHVTTPNLQKITEYSFEYTDTHTKVVTDGNRAVIYELDPTTEKVIARYELLNNIVSAAERYEYTGHLLTKTERASEKELNRYYYEDFTFITATEEAYEYNNFDLVTQKTTRVLGNDGAEKETAVVAYEYTAAHQLATVRATFTNNRGNIPTTHVAVETYAYNHAGLPVRKESYIEGEEYVTGINIEEHVYNEQGHEIKTVTYNSLDSSSKFYTENEVDEDGCTMATFDATGEHKTRFTYAGDGCTVNTEALPNGSKFSYGYAKDGTVTAITHSTEQGEANTNNLTHTLNLVTEMKSGNNTVRYTYDGKRRVKSVSLNGIENYATYEYAGENTDAETITATMADNTVATKVTDLHGNVSEITCNDRSVSNSYNDDQQLTKTIDSVSGETTLTHDNEGNVNSVTAPDHTETFVYAEAGNALESKTITGEDFCHTYVYGYKTTANKALDSISVNDYVIRPSIDVLGRHTGKTIEVGGNRITEEKITYAKFGDHATSLPASVRFATNGEFRESMQYRYDSMGNIIEVSENGRMVCRYEYDALNRLTREDNMAFGKTTTWTYDNNGNILARYEYAITTKPTSELHLLDCETFEYGYADNSDQLMSYNGESFVYDQIGNPTTYRGKTATWEYGRQLKTYNGNTFAYDARGRRIAKNGIIFTYDSNGNLIKQSNGLEFLYDHTGVFAVKHGDATYFYRKNAQNDVVALLDNSGAVVVKYRYDAWGNCNTTVVDPNASTIATLNPFRYRSYYFDTETGFYFLKTRYYDPEIGRFMTIDDIGYLDPDTVDGLNLYAYCLNSPIKYSDPEGTAVITIATVVAVLKLMAIGFAIGAVVGGGFEIANQINNNGWDPYNWDWIQIARSSLGGGIAGAITAIPIPGFNKLGIAGKFLSYSISFFAGGFGSVIGGLISGSVDITNPYSIINSFIIGAFANVVARGVADIVVKFRATKIFNMNRKQKSLKIQKIQAHPLNMGPKALKGGLRNSFKNTSLTDIEKLLSIANPFLRLGIYTGLISSVASELLL